MGNAEQSTSAATPPGAFVLGNPGRVVEWVTVREALPALDSNPPGTAIHGNGSTRVIQRLWAEPQGQAQDAEEVL